MARVRVRLRVSVRVRVRVRVRVKVTVGIRIYTHGRSMTVVSRGGVQSTPPATIDHLKAEGLTQVDSLPVIWSRGQRSDRAKT